MIAKGITREQLQRAAAQVGVSLDLSPLNQKGTRFRVKVNPITEMYLGPRGGKHYRRKYQRISAGWGTAGRKIHAVCWHGFRDFFRACFEQAKDAVFRTALDTWKGSEDFEARFSESAFRNIGPPIAPVSVCEACECPDAGLPY